MLGHGCTIGCALSLELWQVIVLCGVKLARYQILIASQFPACSHEIWISVITSACLPVDFWHLCMQLAVVHGDLLFCCLHTPGLPPGESAGVHAVMCIVLPGLDHYALYLLLSRLVLQWLPFSTLPATCLQTFKRAFTKRCVWQMV